MTMKARLVRLEKNIRSSSGEKVTIKMYTPEQRQQLMSCWLHCHQITRDEVDRESALAYARELHETPVELPFEPGPIPTDVQNALDAHKAEVERERAAMPATKRAALDRWMQEQAALARGFLAEAANQLGATNLWTAKQHARQQGQGRRSRAHGAVP